MGGSCMRQYLSPMSWLISIGLSLLYVIGGFMVYAGAAVRKGLAAGECGAVGGGYAPAHRPVCSYPLASAVTGKHAWRLPLSLPEDTAWLPRPRLSATLSALLPGAGQIYNRSYWKAPIVWGLLGLTGYLAYQNHRQYLFYRQAYREALAGNDPLPPLRPENIRALRESYRQDRDVFLMAFLVGYGLQIGEAYADAHLKGFTIYSGIVPGGVFLALVW